MWLYTSSENAEIEIEMRLFHTQKKVTFFWWNALLLCSSFSQLNHFLQI